MSIEDVTLSELEYLRAAQRQLDARKNQPMTHREDPVDIGLTPKEQAGLVYAKKIIDKTVRERLGRK